VVADRSAVVGDVEHAPALAGEIRARGVRRVGIEEHRIARPRRDRTTPEASHVVVGERLPFFPDEPARVVSGAELEAAVLGGGGVDADHGGDEEIGVGAPAGLLVLMRLEAVAARKLEVDLVLEEDGRLAEEPGHRAAELAAVAQVRELGVERAEVLDPLQHALAWTQEARLEVLHGSPGHLGETLELVGPRRNLRDFLLVEELWNHHEAVTLEGLLLRRDFGIGRQGHLGPPGRRLAQFRVNLPSLTVGPAVGTSVSILCRSYYAQDTIGTDDS
jgi:hypothetical protein